VVPEKTYVHIIESGESLYSIARKYGVTTETIVLANGLSSPDKISVGQKITIPGRVDQIPKASQVATTAAIPAVRKVADTASTAPVKPAPAVTRSAPKPNRVATVPSAGVGKFRWPASGKVITSFAQSNGTGINIKVTEGAAIRAAEAGTVIYVGSAVEGYGNLILVKHDNGFVSAYAHLSQITVSKGDAVMRGDAIGLAGMTGSVNSAQLHFELRKGATPVDPEPMLAS
jgi:murein DD-endopeptidase MepM/ murein hydrolase activator NlpD